jgi:hypothetical protein
MAWALLYQERLATRTQGGIARSQYDLLPLRSNYNGVRKGHYILMAGCVVALAGFIYEYRSPNRKPTYEGHPASYWFRPGGELKGEEAFQTMGSNAVPYLVSQLNYRESPLARFYGTNFFRLPAWYRQRVGPPSPWTDFGRHRYALLMLSALGSSAATAVPDITRMLKDDPNPFIRAQAAFVLGGIGPAAKPALPALRGIAKGSNAPNEVRVNAAEALWPIDHQCDLVMPYRFAALNSTNDSLRWEAISFLGDYGPLSKTAVPTLIEIVAHHKDERFRAKAATTLGRIGPDASAAIPALQEALKDEYLNVRDTAREALREIQRN